MMLRSSSTPVLGSLLPSISSESPNNNHHHHHHHDTTLNSHKTSPIHKFSFHRTSSPGSQHFTTLSCSSSPLSPSFGNGRIRRAQSEGNLESLMNSCGGGGDDHDEEFSFFTPPKKFSGRLHSSLLETSPSFSYHNSRFKSVEEEPSDEDKEQEEDNQGFGEFHGFNMENKVSSLNKQLGFGNSAIKDGLEEASSQMYLAKGIGVDVGFGCGDGGAANAGGGCRNLSQVGNGEGSNGGGDNHGVEEHYRKMVTENPGNPLCLRNYAQFLYQSKQDLKGAEEYYSRAILVDPNDGEILSQYAKLQWELHHDKDRATGYFERAVQAASEDSDVHAAYASFLWETEAEDDEDEEGYHSNIPTLYNKGTMASATA